MPRNAAPGPDVLHRSFRGESLLIDTRRDRVFGLEESAHRCWELLLEHRDPEVVVRVLSQEYDGDAELISRDVEQFLRDLKRRGLVEVSSDPSGDATASGGGATRSGARDSVA